MVIIRTSAVEVSIQAVSPESSAGSCAMARGRRRDDQHPAQQRAQGDASAPAPLPCPAPCPNSFARHVHLSLLGSHSGP